MRMDARLLDEMIVARGMKYSFLARELGVSNYGFYKKRVGQTEFTASEVAALSRLLALPQDVRDAIFFCECP